MPNRQSIPVFPLISKSRFSIFPIVPSSRLPLTPIFKPTPVYGAILNDSLQLPYILYPSSIGIEIKYDFDDIL